MADIEMPENEHVASVGRTTRNQVWVHPDGTWSSIRRDGSENYIHVSLQLDSMHKDAEIERLKQEIDRLRGTRTKQILDDYLKEKENG